MEFLRQKLWLGAQLALFSFLAGCSGGDLTTAATSIVEVQRTANLTRTSLSGTWQGHIVSLDGLSRQTISLDFVETEDLSLDGSTLTGENILLGGGVSQDIFSLKNGSFNDNKVRFSIEDSETGELILMDGEPVLFDGELTENNFMHGVVKAGSQVFGVWEASTS